MHVASYSAPTLSFILHLTDCYREGGEIKEEKRKRGLVLEVRRSHMIESRVLIDSTIPETIPAALPLQVSKVNDTDETNINAEQVNCLP